MNSALCKSTPAKFGVGGINEEYAAGDPIIPMFLKIDAAKESGMLVTTGELR